MVDAAPVRPRHRLFALPILHPGRDREIAASVTFVTFGGSALSTPYEETIFNTPPIAPQCTTVRENRFSTSTPATISAMPIMAGQSSRCPCTIHAIPATSTTPAPDQMA